MNTALVDHSTALEGHEIANVVYNRRKIIWFTGKPMCLPEKQFELESKSKLVFVSFASVTTPWPPPY